MTSGHSWWVDTFRAAHLFSQEIKSIHKLKASTGNQSVMAHRLSAEGSLSDLQSMSQDMSPNAKQDVSCEHSEKLAIACAIINTSEGTDTWVV